MVYTDAGIQAGESLHVRTVRYTVLSIDDVHGRIRDLHPLELAPAGRTQEVLISVSALIRTSNIFTILFLIIPS